MAERKKTAQQEGMRSTNERRLCMFMVHPYNYVEGVIGRFLGEIREQQRLDVGRASAEQTQSSAEGNLMIIHSADPILC
jgi:hypothetical protein